MTARFDYCTIIGRSPSIFRAHVDNVLCNAGLSRKLWNFHTIVYVNDRIQQHTTDEILAYAATQGIITHRYHERPNPHNDRGVFLKNLYDCWNLCQTVGGTPLNMRAGSDQAFGPNAFKNTLDAYDCWEQDGILFHNLIECKSNVGDTSRHILEDFGRNWDEFDEDAFRKWCGTNERSELAGHARANALWGAPRDQPRLKSNGRADGASWLQSKALFEKYGPMPPRYPGTRMTGDIGIMEKMRDDNVPMLICGDATTYHFSRGESEPK